MRASRAGLAALLAVITAFVVVGAGAAACKKSGEDSAAGAPAGSGGKGGKGGARGAGLMYAVDVIPIESKKVSYVVTSPGTIDAFERVQVTARVAGAVDRVSFGEGQQVKKGDVLVVIDSARYQLAVNVAKAQLAKAQAAQSDTEAQATRRQGATDAHPGLIPGEEVASYQTKAVTAKADTAVAQENEKSAELNLRDSFVRAPMDGIIQTRTVETGQYVNPGYVMATLLRNDPMLLRFNVEPADAPRLKPGMTASFTMRETQRQFTAKISLVGGSADPTTHMVPVTAELTEAEHKYWLRPGSFCDVSVDIGGERDAPVIPRLAVRASDHGYIVYVVDDAAVAHEKVVTLGMNTKDGWVEIRSGLTAGELLVVHGGEALSDGAHVRATKIAPDSVITGGDGGAGVPLFPTGGDGGAGGFGRRGDGGAGGGGGGRRGGAGAGGNAGGSAPP